MTSKRINQGKIEVDYDDCALVVNYEIETLYIDEYGRPREAANRAENIKTDSKRIKLKNLAAETNLAQLAADIVDKCKYLHPSRAEEVEQHLIKLKKHMVSVAAKETSAGAVSAGTANGGNNVANNDSKPGKDRERDRERDRDRPREKGDRDRGNNNTQAPAQPAAVEEDPLPDANIRELDDYLDMLYQVSGRSDKEREEGLRLQIRGTAMILKLCREVIVLEQLIQNSTVMGALTRVLQEEFKKSTELTFNILRIFLAFSNFVEMHALMANYRIGLLTMKAIEYEIKRSELREVDGREKEQQLESDIRELKAKLKSGGLDEQATTEAQHQMDKLKKTREKDATNSKRLQKKQDKLLFVAFYVLLNLAEDVTVEKKMIKKNLVESLSAMLDHNYGDLLVLCITFLKKLSMFEENKDTMKSINIVNKLSRFVPCSSQQLVTATLRLLFNLSFDSDVREQIMRCGMVPKLINLLKTPAFRARTLKLLYHLSVDDRCKSMFTYTDGIPLVMGMIVNFPQPVLARELAALSINLSLNPRNAELMVANKGLNHLMDRLGTTRDVLLLKIIRNISQWTFNLQKEGSEATYKYRSLWSPHFKVLLDIVRSADNNHDLLIEAIGTLANMTSLDIPANTSWARILKEHSLLSLLQRMLINGMAQNDLTLEVVMLLGAAATDPKACEYIASSNQMIQLLSRLWEDKVDDVEIVLQVVHVLYKLLLNETSREEVMYSSERIVSRIIDALGHRSSAIRNIADTATELILEFDRQVNGELGLLGIQIRKKRYESYNMAWLQEMGSGGSGNGGSSSSGSGGVNMSLNMSNMSSMATHGNMGIMGNLYGPHGAINHMLDDGDSMVSMGPGNTLHDIADKMPEDEWSPRLAAGMHDDEAVYSQQQMERYGKEVHGRRIAEDFDGAAHLSDHYNDYDSNEYIRRRDADDEYNEMKRGGGGGGYGYQQRGVSMQSDEDDSHELGDSFGHEWSGR